MIRLTAFRRAFTPYLPAILGTSLLTLALLFCWSQRNEIAALPGFIAAGNRALILAGVSVTAVYLALHAFMYQACFRAAGSAISFPAAVHLYLRRNLASVFLPGGGVTSLALFTADARKRGVSSAQVHTASYLYGFIGIVSLVVVAIPVLTYEAWLHSGVSTEYSALALLIGLAVALGYIFYDIRENGPVRRFISPLSPAANRWMTGMSQHKPANRAVLLALGFSLLIEVTGIVHLAVALGALHITSTVEVWITGYVIATVLLCISPFLRGLGAVEVSMVIVLERFGAPRDQALAATVLYRLFEFWLPLACGILSLSMKKAGPVLRLFPAVLLFMLGMVNITSVLTPAIAARLHLLREFLPAAMIDASNQIVLAMGVVLLVVAVMLFRGYRHAWQIGVAVSGISFVGHVTKAFDYEEASLALLTMATLLLTRRQYFIRRIAGRQRVKPAVSTDRDRALTLLKKYGRSPVDYFKVYPDKLLFFGSSEEGFVAYKISGHYAVVLEEPVCANTPAAKQRLLKEFEIYCCKNSRLPFHYRVDHDSIDLYTYMGKQLLLIGQEALVDVTQFTLEGKQRKSLRNALNSISRKGFTTKVIDAPVPEPVMTQIESVSREWLGTNRSAEVVFSQGMFNRDELRDHTVVVLAEPGGRICAFLNVIPNYAKGEATYDLIRKTADAPAGAMDVLIVELIGWCRERGYRRLNLGLAPMSGICKGKGLPEMTLKFAYDHIGSFRRYRGLRDFKEKFQPTWQSKYLAYDYAYDLLHLPVALHKVMKA